MVADQGRPDHAKATRGFRSRPAATAGHSLPAERPHSVHAAGRPPDGRAARVAALSCFTRAPRSPSAKNWDATADSSPRCHAGRRVQPHAKGRSPNRQPISITPPTTALRQGTDPPRREYHACLILHAEHDERPFAARVTGPHSPLRTIASAIAGFRAARRANDEGCGS